MFENYECSNINVEKNNVLKCVLRIYTLFFQHSR